MGVKGNGKGRPLVKEGSSEIEDGEEDADDYEEEQAEEESFECPTLTTKPALRDRLQLKKPSYIESTDGQDSVEDEFSPPAKRAKRQNRSTHKAQVSDSVDSTATTSSGPSEHINGLETKPGPHSPYGFPAEASSDRLLHRNASPIDDYYAIHGSANHNIAPYDNRYFDNGFDNYSPSVYQQYDQPVFATMQQHAPHQLPYSHASDATNFEATNGFSNDSSEPGQFSSDPVTDDADVPEGFCTSQWYNNYIKHTT